MVTAHDPTEAITVPEAVRREAFSAAMLTLRRVLAESGYRLDVLAELELVDLELDSIERGFGEPSSPFVQ